MSDAKLRNVISSRVETRPRTASGTAPSEDLAGLTIETAVYAGPVAATLLLVSEAREADLLVLTTRGRTELARWALGGMAEKVAHQAKMPVLLLRELGLPQPQPVCETDHLLCVLVPLSHSCPPSPLSLGRPDRTGSVVLDQPGDCVVAWPWGDNLDARYQGVPYST